MNEHEMITGDEYAFPMAVPGDWDSYQNGMSLRDHFAGLALQGLIARSSGIRLADEDVLARGSYAIADAMLAERAKK